MSPPVRRSGQHPAIATPAFRHTTVCDRACGRSTFVEAFVERRSMRPRYLRAWRNVPGPTRSRGLIDCAWSLWPAGVSFPFRRAWLSPRIDRWRFAPCAVVTRGGLGSSFHISPAETTITVSSFFAIVGPGGGVSLGPRIGLAHCDRRGHRNRDPSRPAERGRREASFKGPFRRIASNQPASFEIASHMSDLPESPPRACLFSNRAAVSDMIDFALERCAAKQRSSGQVEFSIR